MYAVGDRIIYSENGVCVVEQIAPLDMVGASRDKLYYHLRPLIGNGTFFAPVESGAFMRPVISREEAEALIASIPDIAPAICTDNRFNHVDAFYKELFRRHTPEAMVAIIKGLHIKMADKKAKSSRADMTLKRAKDILHGELSVALDMDYTTIEEYIKTRIES